MACVADLLKGLGERIDPVVGWYPDGEAKRRKGHVGIGWNQEETTKVVSVGVFRWENHFRYGADDDIHVEPDGPGIDVFDVVADAVADRRIVGDLAPETVDLCQSGDARFDEMPYPVGCNRFPEGFVVFNEMGSRADHAHFSAQHIDELGKLIQTAPSEEGAKGENPVVARFRLDSFGAPIRVCGIHGSELQDLERALVQSGSWLPVEQWTRGLPFLKEGHCEDQRGKNENDNGKCDSEIQQAFDQTVDRVLEWFVLKGEKGVGPVHRKMDGLIEQILPIVVDEDMAPMAGAGIQHGAEPETIPFRVQNDDLIGGMIAQD